MYGQGIEEWDRVYSEECKGNEEVQVTMISRRIYDASITMTIKKGTR